MKVECGVKKASTQLWQLRNSRSVFSNIIVAHETIITSFMSAVEIRLAKQVMTVPSARWTFAYLCPGLQHVSCTHHASSHRSPWVWTRHRQTYRSLRHFLRRTHRCVERTWQTNAWTRFLQHTKYEAIKGNAGDRPHSNVKECLELMETHWGSRPEIHLPAYLTVALLI